MKKVFVSVLFLLLTAYCLLPAVIHAADYPDIGPLPERRRRIQRQWSSARLYSLTPDYQAMPP